MLNYYGLITECALQYILTSGLDSIVKLWELSTNRCLIAYTGAGATGAQEYPIHASFNHNEDYGFVFMMLLGSFLYRMWQSFFHVVVAIQSFSFCIGMPKRCHSYI